MNIENNSKPKHTPGPWKIGYSDESGPEYITSDDHSLATLRWGCSCCKDTPDSFKDMTEEEQANAKLIAAAPDLLEALKFCKSVIEAGGIFDLSEKMAFDKAKEAIKKATE